MVKQARLRLCGKECNWQYEEIDLDVFTEKLESAYAHMNRIAAVWLKVTRVQDDSLQIYLTLCVR